MHRSGLLLTEGHEIGYCLWHILAIQAHNNPSCRQESIPFADIHLQHLQTVGRQHTQESGAYGNKVQTCRLAADSQVKVYLVSHLRLCMGTACQKAYVYGCFSQAI